MKEFDRLPKVIGTKQTLRALEAGKVARVIIAQNADDALRDKLIEACRVAGVTPEFCADKIALGSAAGISRGAAVVSILKADGEMASPTDGQ